MADSVLVVGGDVPSLEGGRGITGWSKWPLRILFHGPGEESLSIIGEGSGVMSIIAARAGEGRPELGLKLAAEMVWRRAGVSRGEAEG